MACNMMDYIRWRGDLSFAENAPNAVDFLIFSELVHAPLELLTEKKSIPNQSLQELTPLVYPQKPTGDEKQLPVLRYQLWMAAAESRRFGSCGLDCISTCFDEEEKSQFAAALFTTENFAIAAFRGTDATLVGWHEDFRLSFESPIPSQQYALQFLEEVSGMSEGFYLCGHSKGGNLAMYAAAHASKEMADSILAVYNYDGPGLDDATLDSEEMAAMEPRIHSYMPESSVIGKLLGYQTRHTLIESGSVSVYQHNPFYWHVIGPDFETAAQSTLSSRYTDEALHTFLRNCNREQRRVLIETLFSVLECSDAVKTADIGPGLLRHWNEALFVIKKLPQKDRAAFVQALTALLSSLGSAVPTLLKGLLEKLSEALPENPFDSLLKTNEVDDSQPKPSST